MDKEQQKKRGKFAIISGIGELFFGALMMILASGEKETWEYYLSSSRRSDVDMVTMLGWLFIIAGIAELVYGVIAMSVNEEPQTGNTITAEESSVEWFEGELVDRMWDDKNPRVEWFILKQRSGVTIKLWHNISDNQTYKVGLSGMVRSVDRQITEFISSENVC